MSYTVVVLGGVFILSLVWYYFPVHGGVIILNDPCRPMDGCVVWRWAMARVTDDLRVPASCRCELLTTFSHFNWVHLVKQKLFL